jgi:signal transduction histidine kinase
VTGTEVLTAASPDPSGEAPPESPSDGASGLNPFVLAAPLVAIALAAAVAAPLVDSRAALDARIVPSAVLACFTLAGLIAINRRSAGRLGLLLLVVAGVAAVGVVSGSILEAHVLGSTISSGLVSTARLTEPLAFGLLPVAVMHSLLCLPDGSCTQSRVAIGAGYILGIVVGVLVWWKWKTHLDAHLWIFALEAVVVVLFGIGASTRRYSLAHGMERRRMQWFGCAALVEASVVLAAVALRVLFDWPTRLPLLLEVSTLPYAIALVVATSRRAEERVEGLLSVTVRLIGLTTVVVAVYLLVLVGYGPALTPGEHFVLALSVVSAGVAAVLWLPGRELLTRFADRVAYGERYSPASVLQTFGNHSSRAIPMDELLLQVAESLHKNLVLESAEIWLGSNGRLERAVSVPDVGESRIVLSSEEAAVVASAGVSGSAWVQIWLPALLVGRESSSVRVAPATHSGEVLGLILAVRATGADSFGPEDDTMLAELARQTGLALHNVALDSALQASLDEVRRQAEELKASRARIVAASDAARRQIERNLHDGAQQHLVALAVNLRLARRLSETDPASTGELLDGLAEGLNAAVQELRALAHGIYPPLLVDRGLAEALQSAAGRSALPTIVEAEGLDRYSPDEEAAVYFCCLEALQNAGKHAGEGATATVKVWEEAGGLLFEVSDTGAGFDVGTVGRTGAGFVNMSDRVGAIGGSVNVRSAPGEGTTISGRFPISR